MISLKSAIKFHGHLGPYLVLGLKAGELALKELKAKKHFGIEVKVWGALKRPKSCLVDGLQLSCGATYGKGNIEKIRRQEQKVKMLFSNTENNKKLEIKLKDELIKKLESLKGHRGSEAFAKRLYKTQGEENGAFRIRYL